MRSVTSLPHPHPSAVGKLSFSTTDSPQPLGVPARLGFVAVVLLMSLLLVYVWMRVVYMCVGYVYLCGWVLVPVCMSTMVGGGKQCLALSLSHFLESESLTEPGAKLAVSKPQRTSCLCHPKHRTSDPPTFRLPSAGITSVCHQTQCL